MHTMMEKPKEEIPDCDRELRIRPKDQRIIEAIDAVAKKERRSRNQMAQILLEDALAELGAWPPQECP